MCEVRRWCKLKQCEDPNNRWINESNCSCLQCIKYSIELDVDQKSEMCEWSGEAYNTDGDCLMEK